MVPIAHHDIVLNSCTLLQYRETRAKDVSKVHKHVLPSWIGGWGWVGEGGGCLEDFREKEAWCLVEVEPAGAALRWAVLCTWEVGVQIYLSRPTASGVGLRHLSPARGVM